MEMMAEEVTKALEKCFILIPYHNEGAKIIPLLNSLRYSVLSDYHRIEVIFIGDFPDKFTTEIVNKWIKKLPFKCYHLLNTERNGKRFALWFAIEKYGLYGTKVVTMDADTYFHPLFLEKLYDVITSQNHDFIQIPVLIYERGHGFIGDAQVVEFSGIAFLNNLLNNFNLQFISQGACMSFKPSKELKNHLFSLRYPYGDDMFIMQYFHRKGEINFVAERGLFILTRPVTKISDFYKQRIRWLYKMEVKKFPLITLLGLLTWFVQIAYIYLAFKYPFIFLLFIIFEVVLFFRVMDALGVSYRGFISDINSFLRGRIAMTLLYLPIPVIMAIEKLRSRGRYN